MQPPFNFIGQQAWPSNVTIPAASQTGCEVMGAVLVTVALLVALRNIVVRGDHRLLICMIGGALSVVIEVHTTHMLNFFYPEVGLHVLFAAFGHPIPIFVMFSYSAFFGLIGYAYMNTKLARQFDATIFCAGMAAFFLVELVEEVASIRAGVWGYFGDQPFVVLHFPIHVAIVCAGMCVVIGSVGRLWFDYVEGKRQYWLVLLYPVMALGTFDVFVYPFALANSLGEGINAARIGSVVTILLTAVLAYNVAKYSSKIPCPARAAAGVLPIQPGRAGGGMKSGVRDTAQTGSAASQA